jgi:NhaP-type Na+/H+ or K+/H+ antiporter
VAAPWFLLVGVLLIAVALLGRFLDRLPVSLAMIYLLVGFVLGPAGTNALELHPMRHLQLLGSITEVALLIALFTVGIKLRVPVGDWRWALPLRLATVSMLLTIAGVTATGIWLLGLSPGEALVLGGILAPTDPVLASDVQLRSAQDRDTLRFALTGEGGLNDGTAFPVVLLGLGLLGLHDVGAHGLRWLAVDVVWGTVGGYSEPSDPDKYVEIGYSSTCKWGNGEPMLRVDPNTCAAQSLVGSASTVPQPVLLGTIPGQSRSCTFDTLGDGKDVHSC